MEHAWSLYFKDMPVPVVNKLLELRLVLSVDVIHGCFISASTWWYCLTVECFTLVHPHLFLQDVGKKITGNHGRRRFQELRQRMQTEDEDTGLNNTSPPDSQTSSVEGVFAVPSKTSHPFRIIEHDALSLQSMTSLGRVGRILGGSIDNTGEISLESLLLHG